MPKKPDETPEGKSPDEMTEAEIQELSDDIGCLHCFITDAVAVKRLAGDCEMHGLFSPMVTALAEYIASLDEEEHRAHAISMVKQILDETVPEIRESLINEGMIDDTPSSHRHAVH